MDDSEKIALREWAEQIVKLEPDVVDAVSQAARGMSGDRRLQKSDREFAQAQVQAITQAKNWPETGRKTEP